MELNSLFSILEGIMDDIPQLFYETLKDNMKARLFKNAKVILKIGEPIKHFYYLKKGIVTGYNKSGNQLWFCEENEIIPLSNYSTYEYSSYNIVVEKGSIIYQISLQSLYKVTDDEFAIRLLESSKRSADYFWNMHADMKSQTIDQKIKLISKSHPQFVKSRPILLSAFIGASVTRVSSARKKFSTG